MSGAAAPPGRGGAPPPTGAPRSREVAPGPGAGDGALRERLAELLDLHFDPRWGAPFWLEAAAALDFDPRREIRELRDLDRLPAVPMERLAERPVTDFLPRRYHGRRSELVTSETGGTTGRPRRTVFLREEFLEAFVEPFVRAAARVGFPEGLDWLYVGPGGPHVIGKAARVCARALGSIDPFTVDFDPRWVRRLPADSLARRRYLEHVLEQALAVLESQEIGVLFATPPVLEALADRLPDSTRERIRGVHLGGMAVAPAFRTRLAEWFPRAVSLAGYGNSLAGMCPELVPAAARPPEYFPFGARLVLGVEAEASGARGRVFFRRLDWSCLLPRVPERDEAELVLPPADAWQEGFALPGVRDPRPPAGLATELGGGLY